MSMEAAGVPSHIFVMEAGERHKSLDTLSHIYRWLAERKAERGHLIVAVGGGVVGDVAGYAAATYLRGMPVVQAPTTLVAMMDAAVGGKTAVDLPQGKKPRRGVQAAGVRSRRRGDAIHPARPSPRFRLGGGYQARAHLGRTAAQSL